MFAQYFPTPHVGCYVNSCGAVAGIFQENCWCPGSMGLQVISSKAIDYAE